jgi:predicted PurR-regulated permease PerM
VSYLSGVNSPPNRRVPVRSRTERRITVALKLLALIVLAAIALHGLLGFIGRVRSVAIVLTGAVFFTYLIYPAVRRLSARMPVFLAILLVYAGLAVVAVLGLSFVVPALANDTQSIVAVMPQNVQRAQSFLADPENPIVKLLPDSVRGYLTAEVPDLLKAGQHYASAQAGGAVLFVLSTFALIATVVVIPVISIYLILEAPDLLHGFMRLVPPRARPKTSRILRDLDRVLGGFIRGQMLVGLVIGAAITIVLLLMHVRYAVLIGVVAGLFDIIPFVGSLVAFVPAVLFALQDGWQHALIVALLIVGIFQAEGHLIQPKIVSDSVGLSPLTVIVAILIGADLLGIAGMFIAVPIVAMLRVLVQDLAPDYPETGSGLAEGVQSDPPKRVTAKKTQGVSV